MNHTLRRQSAVLALAFAPLHAQKPLEPPLKNWAAPLYWASQPAERHRPAQRKGSPVPEQGGIFAGSGVLTFIAILPCRAMDTRAGQGFGGAFGPPSLSAYVARVVPLPSSTACDIPSNAAAYSLNITAVTAGPLSFLTVWPAGDPYPGVSTLNAPSGGIVANAAIVVAGTAGAIQIVAGNPTDVIVDINGYYAAPTDGNSNTGLGALALNATTVGVGNTGVGASALANNNTGNYDTASGYFALESNTTGSNNIAIGYQAANSVSGGNSNNIHIGSLGAIGDNGTIRIGTPATQTSFFAAGVQGVTTGAADAVAVLIDANGQLGTVSSSARFKEDIEDMGDASDGLLRLRPVTFRYKKPYADGSRPLDYGLIAEEVAQVYPDLVVKGKDGQIETVQYQKVNAMLLNEVQKQYREIQNEHQRIEEQQEELGALKARLSDLQKAIESLAIASANR